MRVFEGADKAGRMSAFYIPVSVFVTVIYIVYYTTSMYVRISWYSTISMSPVRVSGFF